MEQGRRSVAGWIYWIGKTGLTLVGLLVVCATGCAALGRSLLFKDVVLESVSSPGRFYRAELINTEGGIYHQNRYRVWVHDSRTVQRWLIYKTKTTEDAPPSIEWVSSEILVLGLPCGVIGHAANPDDWERSNPKERRLRVRFKYRDGCGAASAAPAE